jgi:hypothetical protein
MESQLEKYPENHIFSEPKSTIIARRTLRENPHRHHRTQLATPNPNSATAAINDLENGLKSLGRNVTAWLDAIENKTLQLAPTPPTTRTETDRPNWPYGFARRSVFPGVYA